MYKMSEVHVFEFLTDRSVFHVVGITATVEANCKYFAVFTTPIAQSIPGWPTTLHSVQSSVWGHLEYCPGDAVLYFAMAKGGPGGELAGAQSSHTTVLVSRIGIIQNLGQ
jgi:hypothetical protein